MFSFLLTSFDIGDGTTADGTCIVDEEPLSNTGQMVFMFAWKL